MTTIAHVGDSDTLRSTWAELPLTRQRATVSTVRDRAIVRPAVGGPTTFDPDRIEPIWWLGRRAGVDQQAERGCNRQGLDAHFWVLNADSDSRVADQAVSQWVRECS